MPDDAGVGLGAVLPWFQPTLAVGLADGVGEIDISALTGVYSYASPARLVPVSTGSSISTAHGVVVLTTPAASFRHRASRLVLPGAHSDREITPALGTLAARRGIPFTALSLGNISGFDAALTDLTASSGTAIGWSTTKMMDYPNRPAAQNSAPPAVRAPLLFALAIVLATTVGLTPTSSGSSTAGITTAGPARNGGHQEPGTRIPGTLTGASSPWPEECPRQEIAPPVNSRKGLLMVTTATTPTRLLEPPVQRQTARSRIGLVVAGSLAAGLTAATLLVAAPVVAADEHRLTAMVLLGFALGWAVLVVLSVRLTDQPQRWAAAPAAFLTVLGVTLLVGSAAVRHVLGWAWPPALLVLVMWMVVQVRRELRSRSGRWLLYPVVTLLGIAALGGGYETVRESLDARAYPAPGQLVDVGGHRLHLSCTGSGSPTVVLEPGQGGVSSDFAWIATAVASDTRVCVYDRAGRGWSDPADDAQHGEQIAADLHTLLHRAHVPGPYVLAGHSFGGLYVQSFAAQFPGEVAGLVLLDSTAPKPGPALPTTTSDTVLDRVVALVPAVAHLGAGRLIAQASYGTLPAPLRDSARARASLAGNLDSFIEEFLEANRSMQQAAALTDLKGKPLLVLTADTGQDPGWQQKQDNMATLSTNSLHRVANATTHESMVSDRTDAAAASQAINDVVAAVRTSQRLTPR